MEINRRTALLGLATAGAVVPLLAVPAHAQTQPASSIAGANNYVQQTLLVGTVAMKTSEIAVQKATDPNVKKFAELEVAEQKTIASVLSATPGGKQPPELPPDRQKMIDDLNSMQQGPDFDQAYLQGQIEGHNELLKIQQTMSGEKEASVEAVTARLAEQGVASHLAMLNLIQQMLGAENIQNIQQGQNPDGSTNAGGNAGGGQDAGAQGGDQGGGDQQAPSEGTAPANNGG
jgi:putative membrane protein